jgi:hypothetical protein
LKNILFNAVVSFLCGIIGGLLVLVVCLNYIKPQPLKFYTFDIATAINSEQNKLLNNSNPEEAKKEIDRFVTETHKKLSKYDGIVFVKGTVIGTGKTKDVTNEVLQKASQE